MNIIRLLPEAIANQIAAGEVVQRPASIVKELLENSVDAGATHITLVVKDAGRALVQVIDNGKGMTATDAVLSFARHATSKISQAEDLFSIRSMGFRGEALASIASVAQVEMRTCADGFEMGTHLIIEGSEIKLNEPIAATKGTSIAVKNLFYNIPARRAFLKSNTVELSHIMTEFTRVAMAFPSLSFTMKNGDSEVYQLHGGKLAQRIIDLLGANFKNQLAPCETDTEIVRIYGYIGKPEMSKKTRGEQFFFVNNRYVKHQYFHHAVLQAFDGLLAADTYPFYVLFFEINPAQIDVNVHPTKTELKFEYEKQIYAILRATVRNALSAYNVMPSLDFDAKSSLSMLLANAPLQNHDRGDNPVRNTAGSASSSMPVSKPNATDNLSNWGKLYNDMPSREAMIDSFMTETSTLPQIEQVESAKPLMAGVQGQQLVFQSAANSQNLASTLLLSDENSVLQIQQRYLIVGMKTGMMVIDQHAAHERILYEKLMNQMSRNQVGSQQKLFPKTIDFSPAEFEMLMKLQGEFAQHNFLFESFGTHTIKLTALPVDLPVGEEAAAFHELLDYLKNDQPLHKLSFKELIARTLARRSAIKWGVSLSQLEMNDLVERLFKCELPHYTPSGEAIVSIVPTERLASLFDGGIL